MHSLCSVQAMGVTNFINPKDEEKPVYEVGILCHFIFSKENTIHICILIFDQQMYLQRIREITDGGVHYSFECTGNVDVLRDAFLSSHEVLYCYIQASFLTPLFMVSLLL